MANDKYVFDFVVNTRFNGKAFSEINNQLNLTDKKAHKLSLTLSNAGRGDGFRRIERSLNAIQRRLTTLNQNVVKLNQNIGNVGRNSGFRQKTKEANNLTKSVNSAINATNKLNKATASHMTGNSASGRDSNIAAERGIDRRFARGMLRTHSPFVMTNPMVGMFGFFGLQSMKEATWDLGVKDETNKLLMENMGASYERFDEITNRSLTSLQDLIPAMNAQKAIAGLTSEQVDLHAETVAKFGTYARILSGSQDRANEAMLRLAKGYHGQFMGVDQYGITKESLKATGKYSGEGDTYEHYMEAVNEIMGTQMDKLMNTVQGQMAVAYKGFTRAGKDLTNMIMPVIKPLLVAFNTLNKVLNGLPAKILIVGGAFLGAAAVLTNFYNQAIAVVDTFKDIQDRIKYMKAGGSFWDYNPQNPSESWALLEERGIAEESVSIFDTTLRKMSNTVTDFVTKVKAEADRLLYGKTTTSKPSNRSTGPLSGGTEELIKDIQETTEREVKKEAKKGFEKYTKPLALPEGPITTPPPEQPLALGMPPSKAYRTYERPPREPYVERKSKKDLNQLSWKDNGFTPFAPWDFVPEETAAEKRARIKREYQQKELDKQKQAQREYERQQKKLEKSRNNSFAAQARNLPKRSFTEQLKIDAGKTPGQRKIGFEERNQIKFFSDLADQYHELNKEQAVNLSVSKKEKVSLEDLENSVEKLDKRTNAYKKQKRNLEQATDKSILSLERWDKSNTKVSEGTKKLASILDVDARKLEQLNLKQGETILDLEYLRTALMFDKKAFDTFKEGVTKGAVGVDEFRLRIRLLKLELSELYGLRQPVGLFPIESKYMGNPYQTLNYPRTYSGKLPLGYYPQPNPEGTSRNYPAIYPHGLPALPYEVPYRNPDAIPLSGHTSQIGPTSEQQPSYNDIKYRKNVTPDEIITPDGQRYRQKDYDRKVKSEFSKREKLNKSFADKVNDAFNNGSKKFTDYFEEKTGKSFSDTFSKDTYNKFAEDSKKRWQNFDREKEANNFFSKLDKRFSEYNVYNRGKTATLNEFGGKFGNAKERFKGMGSRKMGEASFYGGSALGIAGALVGGPVGNALFQTGMFVDLIATLYMLYDAIGGWARIKPVLTSIWGIFKNIIPTIKSIWTILMAITGLETGPLLLALAAVVGALLLIKHYWENIMGTMQQFFNWVKNIVITVFIEPLIPLFQALDDLWNALSEIFGGDPLVALGNALLKVLEPSRIILELLAKIAGFIFRIVLTPLVANIKALAQGLSWLYHTISDGVNWIKTAIKPVTDAISNFFNMIKEKIQWLLDLLGMGKKEEETHDINRDGVPDQKGALTAWAESLVDQRDHPEKYQKKEPSPESLQDLTLDDSSLNIDQEQSSQMDVSTPEINTTQKPTQEMPTQVDAGPEEPSTKSIDKLSTKVLEVEGVKKDASTEKIEKLIHTQLAEQIKQEKFLMNRHKAHMPIDKKGNMEGMSILKEFLDHGLFLFEPPLMRLIHRQLTSARKDKDIPKNMKDMMAEPHQMSRMHIPMMNPAPHLYLRPEVITPKSHNKEVHTSDQITPITNYFTIHVDNVSEESHIQKIVDEITRALTWENIRAGRTIGNGDKR